MIIFPASKPRTNPVQTPFRNTNKIKVDTGFTGFKYLFSTLTREEMQKSHTDNKSICDVEIGILPCLGMGNNEVLPVYPVWCLILLGFLLRGLLSEIQYKPRNRGAAS